MSEENPNIDDISFLDAEDAKLQNTKFYKDPDLVYEVVGDPHPDEVRRRIWRVSNSKIRKILRRFPLDEPLQEQCALWMQAFVGKHFFPDANHRTGVVLLREMMARNYLNPSDWSIERTRKAREESHNVRGEMDLITLADVYRRDTLYEVWHNYFGDVLR